MRIAGGRDGVRVYIFGPARASSSARESLSAAFREALISSKDRLSKQRHLLTRFDVIVNPYFREQEIMQQARDVLEGLVPPEAPKRPPSSSPSRKYNQYLRSLNDYRSQSTNVRYHSLALLTHAPICGESFINLVLFLLGRDPIRDDRRLADAILRSDIDVRIKGLALYCEGFPAPINSADERFTKFHSVMKRRNRRFHGAIDPLGLRIAEVFMDGGVALFRSHGSPLIMTHGVDDLQALRNEALSDAQIVEDFIAFVLDSITEPQRTKVREIMKTEFTGWSDEVREMRPLGSSAVWIELGHQRKTTEPGSAARDKQEHSNGRKRHRKSGRHRKQ